MGVSKTKTLSEAQAATLIGIHPVVSDCLRLSNDRKANSAAAYTFEKAEVYLMPNLVEGIQEQMNRCRELVKEYEAIGPEGTIGAALIKQDIANGERALASHDVVEMARAYKALEGCE